MMTATVYGIRTGSIVAERSGDLLSLVDWFDQDFGEGYTCIIKNSSGEVLHCLEYSVGYYW